MESDIYGNTALPLAPDLQSLQTPHMYKTEYVKKKRVTLKILRKFEMQMITGKKAKINKKKESELK